MDQWGRERVREKAREREGEREGETLQTPDIPPTSAGVRGQGRRGLEKLKVLRKRALRQR